MPWIRHNHGLWFWITDDRNRYRGTFICYTCLHTDRATGHIFIVTKVRYARERLSMAETAGSGSHVGQHCSARQCFSVVQNAKLSSIYRQNISLFPYILHVPAVKSTDCSKETRKNILSLTGHKIYKRTHLYSPQLLSSINWLIVQVRSHLYMSARLGYVANAMPLLLYHR